MKMARQTLIVLALAFVSASAFAEQPSPVGNPAELRDFLLIGWSV